VRISGITPFILTYNEEPNIARCLDRLAWAAQILIVDSGSTDRTLALIANYPQARVVQRTFDSHSAQANFGLALIATPWVLSLDADYILTPEFQQALIEEKFADDPSSVYFAPFRLCVHGRPIRASLYPPRGVLYARDGAFYEQDGHTQRLSLAGRKQVLIPETILHDDRKSKKRWLENQRKYAALEAAKLRATPSRDLGVADRLRRTGWLAPIVIVPYILIIRGGLLDGWRGLSYAFQRAQVELLLAFCLMQARLRTRSDSAAPG
jgi:glycosyltransferase involved in cell wall biosynthesis